MSHGPERTFCHVVPAIELPRRPRWNCTLNFYSLHNEIPDRPSLPFVVFRRKMQKRNTTKKMKNKKNFSLECRMRLKLAASALKLRYGSTTFYRFQFLFYFPWNYCSSTQYCVTHNALFIKFCLHFHVTQWMMFCLSLQSDTMKYKFSFGCHSHFPHSLEVNGCALFGIMLVAAAQPVRQ